MKHNNVKATSSLELIQITYVIRSLAKLKLGFLEHVTASIEREQIHIITHDR